MIELSAIYREYVCACCLRWEYSPLKIGRSRNKSWTRCVCVCVCSHSLFKANLRKQHFDTLPKFRSTIERERARVFLGFCFRIKCGLRGWKHVSILLEVAGCACGCVCLHLSFLHALSHARFISSFLSISSVSFFIALSFHCLLHFRLRFSRVSQICTCFFQDMYLITHTINAQQNSFWQQKHTRPKNKCGTLSTSSRVFFEKCFWINAIISQPH